jgi:hypothetical protein
MPAVMFRIASCQREGLTGMPLYSALLGVRS